MLTLLIGKPESSWNDWLAKNHRSRPLVVLNPAEPTLAPTGTIARFQGDKPVERRFFGSLDLQRSPHSMIEIAVTLAKKAGPDAIFQFAPYRPSPLAHQTLHILCQLLLAEHPGEILIAEGTPCTTSGFPVGPQIVATEAAFPTVVQAAQRRAQWIAFFERAELQEVDLKRVAIVGGRLGSGEPLPLNALPKGAAHGERTGSGLFLIARDPLDDNAVTHALDHFHLARVHIAQAEDYANLFVGFTRENGEDFALGVIESIDFERMVAKVISDAVPPAPVRILKLGSIKVTSDGVLQPEIKPWSL